MSCKSKSPIGDKSNASRNVSFQMNLEPFRERRVNNKSKSQFEDEAKLGSSPASGKSHGGSSSRRHLHMRKVKNEESDAYTGKDFSDRTAVDIYNHNNDSSNHSKAVMRLRIWKARTPHGKAPYWWVSYLVRQERTKFDTSLEIHRHLSVVWDMQAKYLPTFFSVRIYNINLDNKI